MILRGTRQQRLNDADKARVYVERGKDALIDLDGTLCEWHYPELGEPTPGAAEAMRALRAQGYRVVIWTARMDNSVYSAMERIRTFTAIRKWLKDNAIQYDEIDVGIHGKRVAGVYIDDKAVPFRGDWIEALLEVKCLRGRESAREQQTKERYGVDTGN